MKFKFMFTTLLLCLSFMATSVFAQEEEKNEEEKTVKNPPTAEEINGRVEGIDENVTTLLNDVAGLKKFKVSGYLQVQFDKTESAKGFGLAPYDSSYVQGRFKVRRSRVKFSYDAGLTQFVVQGDFSNEKFSLKDAYINITDPWTKYFSLTAGVFNRPNYEVEYSSSQRESMERSAVVKALYPDERDLGAMITIIPENWFKFQFAGFNNTYKGDMSQFYPNFNNEPLYYMARITKEFEFKDLGLGIDLGAHARFGNVLSNSKYVLESDVASNSKTPDSTSTKKGDKLGRNWFGVEAQIYFDFLGGGKILGEFITGSTVNEMATADKTPTALRKRDFSGFYVMLVKNLDDDWQVAAKYDSYNPNTKISDAVISDKAELTTSTLGLGLHNYTFDNVRISLWYDMITTKTNDRILKNDPVDNLLTVRFQYKF